MSFPSPSLSPPSLALYELSYAGVIFGGIDRTKTYQLQNLVGLDSPEFSGGDVQRALDQGEFGGIDVSRGRDVQIQQVVKASTAALLDAARQTLGAALGGPTGQTEQPLYIRLPSGIYACMAKPRKHNFPFDINMVMALGGVINSLLHATDPRWYAAPTKTASVGLPAPLGGLGFPVTFPASFGGGGVGGVLQVTNAGKFEMRPKLIFTGPCTNPVATNLSISGAPGIGFNISLAAGDTLVVDTDFQSVVYTAAGSSVGSSRRNTEKPSNVWWNLPPGLNQIQFNTSDGTQVAGTLTVQSADAWMVL